MHHSQSSKLLHITTPAVLLALASVVAPGCSSGTEDITGGCEIQAAITSVADASTKLDVRAKAMRKALAEACAHIAGTATYDGTNADDNEVKAQCDLATAEITAQLSAAEMRQSRMYRASAT